MKDTEFMEFLNSTLQALTLIDEALARNDINLAIKKTNECLTVLKLVKGAIDNGE